MKKGTDNQPAEQGSSLTKDAWIRLRKNGLAVFGIFFLIFIATTCFLIPILGELTAPSGDNAGAAADLRAESHWYKDPNRQNLTNTFQAIDSNHWLGTDQSGRDLFARLLKGGQISMLVGFVATLIAVSIGVTYGAISGYIGGKTDALLMRIVDVLFGLPQLVLIILFSIVIAKNSEGLQSTLIDEWKLNKDFVDTCLNIVPLCLSIGVLGWFTMARVVRAQVISTKSLEYVEAARSLGLRHSTILFKHIMPNILGPIIVYTSLTVPAFILIEATLSFLGIGVRPPQSSWGILLSEGANYMETKPMILAIPSIIFSLTLLALNFVGDGLRDALDPRSSKD